MSTCKQVTNNCNFSIMIYIPPLVNWYFYSALHVHVLYQVQFGRICFMHSYHLSLHSGSKVMYPLSCDEGGTIRSTTSSATEASSACPTLPRHSTLTRRQHREPPDVNQPVNQEGTMCYNDVLFNKNCYNDTS